MRYTSTSATICLLVILPLSASATQWGYPLTTLPEGWTATPEWDFGSEAAHVKLSAYYTPYPEPLEAYLISDEIVIPAATVETVLEFDHTWSLMGSSQWEQEVYASTIDVSYSIDGDTPIQLLFYYNILFWGEFNPQGSELFSCSLATSPGDTLRFIFHALATADMRSATTGVGAETEWWISNFLLTAYDGQALQPTTWAEIKSFSVEVAEPEEMERAPDGSGTRR